MVKEILDECRDAVGGGLRSVSGTALHHHIDREPDDQGITAVTAPMELGPVGNVFYFVEDFDAAVAWYSARLRRDPIVRGRALVAFDIDGVRLTVHRADEFNAPGPSGNSPYWTVPNVDAVVAEWTAFGASAHRGPKTVFTGERLCQLLDPFGNIFSVREDAAEPR